LALTFSPADDLTDVATERGMIEQLLAIGTALSDNLQIEDLLDLILSKSRDITCSDAGSVYLIDRTDSEPKLIFKAAQTASLPEISFQEAKIPLTTDSLAGYVAVTGESLNIPNAYNLPLNVTYRFDPHFDRDFAYRTVSVLVLPMQNREGETIGVLQLINRKLTHDIRITPDNALAVTQSYSQWEEQIVRSLAAQAAISIERNHLLESIEALFEGFVTAAVTAIEQRDPSTAGHSDRVAQLSVRLSEEVNEIQLGALGSIHFDARQIQEIRYAALLHDFGKIGIPESILQKEKKLYPHQLQEIRHRFTLLQRGWEIECAEAKLAYLFHTPHHHSSVTDCLHCDYIATLDRELTAKLDRLQAYWEMISQINQPQIIHSHSFKLTLEEIALDLQELAQYTYRDLDGNPQPLLTSAEIQQLLIPKGTLTPSERFAIESHVTHTYHFLDRIPWTKHLQNVPQIAGSHHEKLDGSGYPRGLKATAIPIQSQIMAIADIYDALTAHDRPYKPRLSLDRTLQILRQDAAQGKLNADLLALFEQRQVYQVLGH
jgi:HD-GYP domain-containing protein (c-di-GMP phosphodiesterase class II)